MALFFRWVKLTTRLTSDPNDFVKAKTHEERNFCFAGYLSLTFSLSRKKSSFQRNESFKSIR